ILTRLLDTKKPFAFYVNTIKANKPPFDAASKLLHWMRANKTRFKDTLICSVIVYGNTLTNNLVSKLLQGVFAIQPPVSPNKITNSEILADKWIDEKIKDFLK